MGRDHPIAWCHRFDGGRSWYTAMGHAAESYADANFLAHLEGGIESVAGIRGTDGCGKSPVQEFTVQDCVASLHSRC